MLGTETKRKSGSLNFFSIFKFKFLNRASAWQENLLPQETKKNFFGICFQRRENSVAEDFVRLNCWWFMVFFRSQVA